MNETTYHIGSWWLRHDSGMEVVFTKWKRGNKFHMTITGYASGHRNPPEDILHLDRAISPWDIVRGEEVTVDRAIAMWHYLTHSQLTNPWVFDSTMTV